MLVSTKTPPALAPELEAIAATAADRLQAQAPANRHQNLQLPRRFAQAARAAIEDVPLGPIADTEPAEPARERQEPDGEVVRCGMSAARAHGTVRVIIERA